jgi:RNA polymerase sigma factor (sigma-70 family)
MQFRRSAVERRYIQTQLSGPHVHEETVHHDDLQSALKALPYRQRAAIVLRFYLDLSDDDAADILGCAAGTIRSLISRGLAALRSTHKEELDG